ncbi:conserved membrane hypothetical protein [Vibrio chagasii]|nr:conserved membrane hypothetical protein [Vibrio chagasii]CAH6806441.1 conserved membrane hypothetical protein [Vibrio chagasii]CAH6904534.1 conserved membrane hypothetical protein [Vibrio chagasii]CAH6941329.1 conserved membrane hypothetical protein [Vibrio chagasii]CAH6956841.1 conserved membrane hypothetical protein [Vibrio chagasii]
MIKNFIISSFGTLIAQIILFLALPQIAKVWGSDDFGIYSHDVSIGIIIATVLILRLELLIMNDDSNKAKSYFFGVIKLCFLSCIICMVILFNFSLDRYILPLYYGCSLILYNSAILYLSVDRYFFKISLARIVTNLLFVCFAFFMPKDMGIIFYHFIATLITFLFLYCFALKDKNLSYHVKFSKVIHDGKGYILNTFPASICNVSCINIIPVVIPFLFNESKAGVFFLAYKTIIFPVGIVGQSLGNILRRELLANYHDKKERNRVFIYVSLIIFLICLSFYFLVLQFYEMVFLNYFSSEWSDVLSIYGSLLYLSIIMMIYAPLGHVFLCSGNQKTDLIFNFLKAIMLTTFLIVSYINMYDFITFVNYYAVVMGTAYFIGVLLVLHCFFIRIEDEQL